MTSLHTIFLREHNWWCDKILKKTSSFSDEQVFQRARMMVEAEIQHITYKEFLPLLLGTGSIETYTGYKSNVNATVSNEFSTAAYRLGHSLVSETLLRLDKNEKVVEEGNLDLRDGFFNPSNYANIGGINSLLLGASKNICQKLNSKIVNSLRNFLFGQPGSGGLDLASLNIQRGRDHGIADYNSVRVDLGLTAKTSFSDISSDASVSSALFSVYSNVNEIDLWVGGLAENLHGDGQLGETFFTLVKDQFIRSRDGDEYWYENVIDFSCLTQIKNTKLSDILNRNSGCLFQKDVMIL